MAQHGLDFLERSLVPQVKSREGGSESMDAQSRDADSLGSTL